ncbi:ParB N-terminal domain-containing protein [Agromyces sp. S2-1-8]|uniref:ParB/RepB/Spo0J family partition protein n=1 Tax=Agromyces sp. S2-1-8 TaxID=2897180 RepID=UPI001E4F2CDE|nr:ParB N-terminal domain-containing protein [Agromyces sp. S2-1-8]MCD5348433.1 ParB N-terminal domain-containing protein [Agromyces sp. S2-1-8]
MATEITTRTAGAVEHIDPQSIVIEANVRPGDTMKPLTKEFIATIREHGVVMPVHGYRDEQGNVLVRMGQRRTLAAREAGLATIPVYIVDGDQSTARRIIDQLIENEQRSDLTEAERSAAWQQLAFEGMTPNKIAKSTGTKVERVKQGLAVADNAVATAAVVEHEIDLAQAATLIEFEDSPEIVAELIEVAKTDPEQFQHAAQRARSAREIAAKIEEHAVPLREAGFEVLTERPRWDNEDYLDLYRLTTAEGERVDRDTLATLDGRAVLITGMWRVDDTPRFEYFLRGWKEAGYRAASAERASSNKGPMTDEQKAQRKALVANNKAWAAAEVVRREWLATFMSRKTLPKDAAQFIARGLTFHRGDVYRAMQEGNSLAHTLLGIDPGSGWRADKLAEFVTANPTKAQHVSLAIVLGGIEDNTDRGAWRYPEADKAAYLAQIAAWGYTLSEVEQLVIDGAAEKATARAEAAAARAEAGDDEEPEVEVEDFEADDFADEFDYED